MCPDFLILNFEPHNEDGTVHYMITSQTKVHDGHMTEFRSLIITQQKGLRVYKLAHLANSKGLSFPAFSNRVMFQVADKGCFTFESYRLHKPALKPNAVRLKYDYERFCYTRLREPNTKNPICSR